jgi:hypothetical protein
MPKGVEPSMAMEMGKTGRILNLRNLLHELTAKDVVAAAEVFDAQGGKVESFEDSSKYEVVIGGRNYPPKAVFGLAASNKLNQEIRSRHFTGGDSSTSFRILRELGFEIVLKTTRPGHSEGLELYSAYSREDVQKLLAPNDVFVKGSGTWGLQGIVRDKPAEGDVVFFVTLGNHDGNDYEDALTEDGALVWKSQNRHTPKSPVIQALINHDADQNVIYLFLRPHENNNYTYFGPLAFKEWDPLSEKPVHMVWTLLSGPIPRALASQLGIALSPALSLFSPVEESPSQNVSLTETKPPKPRKKSGKANGKSGLVDWSGRDERNSRLGLAGEKLVIDAEKQKLNEAGRHDLADQIEHTALVDSAAGYDIVSFHPETGDKHFIEVKTTTGSHSSAFFISANEIAISEEYGDSYFIYRLYDYYADSGAKFYSVNGSVRDLFELVPTTFRATVKP